MRINLIVVDCEGSLTVYHCASDPRFKSDWLLASDAQDWCYQQWGPGEFLTETPGWVYNGDTFMFDAEDKLVAFQLRWSEDV